ncbi:tRNA preQ1(34) S-adenosylmethionine ribosyltransferase-isomerase QueA [bacterium]|nr:tRNA preQ1(34) S-adenosylmethionine ribosyltransferase-isomerase QueA [bacterium]
MEKDLFKLSSYIYELPQELIAKYPSEERSGSNLLVLDKNTGNIDKRKFHQITDYFSKGDLLLLNDTKVFPSRFFGKKETGANIEIMVIDNLGSESDWTALSRPYKRLKEGTVISFSDNFNCEIIEKLGEGKVWVRFNDAREFFAQAEDHGHVPLPPYLKRADEESDKERYQTVYALNKGAVAAPTAGLHFTLDTLKALKEKGVNSAYITLHTGYGTFAPMEVEDIRDFKIHSEYFKISSSTIDLIRETKKAGGKVFSVGTTTTRTVEYVFKNKCKVLEGKCDLYIYPRYEFEVVDRLLTNFHLPKTSLILLVSAFAGHDNTMNAYKWAIENKFRFYSYGDSMLII